MAPWRRQWQPTTVLLPGKSHGWRSLVGCGPWGHKESDTTEWLHFHFSLSYIGKGNGNPLQCSCLENPRNGGAWWAAVYGVTQCRTRLKWLSRSSHALSQLIWFAWNMTGHNKGIAEMRPEMRHQRTCTLSWYFGFLGISVALILGLANFTSLLLSCLSTLNRCIFSWECECLKGWNWNGLFLSGFLLEMDILGEGDKDVMTL